jgi:hypothetical protein
MTAGEILKKNLGLEKLKHVKISRVVTSSYKILQVFYDSYRPSMPITNYRIKNFPFIARVFHGTDLAHNTDRAPIMTPAIDIEDYNGNIKGALIIPTNLAGDRFVDKKQFSKIFESTLNEKFVDYVKSNLDNKKYALHVNPNSKELQEIREESDSFGIRGIYLSNLNKMFIANADLLHRNIRRRLETKYHPLNLNEFGVYFTTDDMRGVVTIETISDEAFKEFLATDFYNTYLSNYDIDLKEVLLENQQIFLGKGFLKEFVTLDDLNDTDTISDFTSTWRKDRSRVMGQENITAKLVDCVVDEADKSVTFQFLTTATELGNKAPNDNIDSDYRFYSGPKGEVDPETFNITRNRSRTYEMQIKVLEFFDWLDVFEGEKIGRKEINEILEVSNIQVFSTAPSFHYQGMNYNLSQLDGSIYPTTISNPIWGPRHGDPDGYFLDKHLYGLMRQIKFFHQQMGSMLTGKLKNRGLI